MESINEEILKSYGITATVLDACESTNEHALINGGVVFARTQSGGRGRNGRNFYSGEGGIYTSIAFDVIDEKSTCKAAVFLFRLRRSLFRQVAPFVNF